VLSFSQSVSASSLCRSAIEYLLDAYAPVSYLSEVATTSLLKPHLDIVEIALRNLPTNARVLDIGAGGLDKLIPLSFLSFKCSAYDDYLDDWHRESIDDLVKLAHDHSISLHRGDLYHLAASWSLGSFDMIMLNDVIEHCHFSPLSLLQTCFDNLNPGGLLLVTVPSAVNLRKRIFPLIGKSIYPPHADFFLSKGLWRGHIREYVKSDLQFLAHRISSSTTIPRFCIQSKSYMLGTLPRLARLPFRFFSVLMPSIQDSWSLIIFK
jgi:SAM-dependent methyltransferase